MGLRAGEIGQQIRRGALQRDRAVAETQRVLGALLDQDRRQPLRAQLPQRRLQFLDDHRRKPLEGLVERQNAGLVINMRPIASICCSPSDNLSPWLRRRAFRRGNKP